MALTNVFDIELTGRTLKSMLHQPETAAAGSLPAVLFCASPAAGAADASLVNSLVDAMVEGGLAVLVYHPKVADSSDARVCDPWLDAVDDASAAFRRLALHDSVDLTRLGVIGYGPGAVIASCVARRTDQIAGLCLIAPCSKCAAPANGASNAASTQADADSLHPVEDAAHFDRPTLILIAGADEMVAGAESQAYLTALENVEHQVDHLIIARADHEFSEDAVRTICKRHLVGFFQSMPALVHADSNL